MGAGFNSYTNYFISGADVFSPGKTVCVTIPDCPNGAGAFVISSLRQSDKDVIIDKQEFEQFLNHFGIKQQP